MGRQSDCQSSCHCTRFVIINYPPCGMQTYVQHDPRHLTESGITCTPLSPIRVGPCPLYEKLRWLVEHSPVTSPISNCVLTTTADVSWDILGNEREPSLITARQTGLQQNVIIWDTISLDIRTPLVIIFRTLTVQWYVDDILPSVVSLFLLQQLGITFYQDNVRLHTEYVKMNCLQACPIHPWPDR